MGIYIHKALGYGLKDINFYIDSRLNLDSGNWGSERYSKSFEGYQDFLLSKGTWETKSEAASVQKLIDKGKTLNECIKIWDSSLDNDNLEEKSCILLIPASEIGNYYRSDDTLDYYNDMVEIGHEKAMANSFKEIETGIFPYEGTYADSRTGRFILREAKQRWDYTKKFTMEQDVIDKIILDLGFETAENADTYIKPKVPENITLLAEYFDLFTSIDAVHQLTPAVATWWE